jgi:deoxyxylulose-5-phosphate synthase
VLLPGVTSEILLLTYGSLVEGCIEVQENDDRVSVMVFNQLSPLDSKELAEVFSSYELLVVVEDQFAENGLYSSVCRIVAEHQLRGRVRSHSPVDYTLEVGTTREYYAKKDFCDSDGISRLLTRGGPVTSDITQARHRGVNRDG